MKRHQKFKVGKWLLIYDTGDFVFSSKREAQKYAASLKRRGHKIDRIQPYLAYRKKAHRKH